MFTKTFTTKSTKHGWKDLEVTLEFPSDPSEHELIEARFGSLTRAFEVAAGGGVISCQTGMREQETTDLAVEYAHAFCDNGKKSSGPKVWRVPEAPEGEPWSETQVEAMKASARRQGLKVIDEESDEG